MKYVHSTEMASQVNYANIDKLPPSKVWHCPRDCGMRCKQTSQATIREHKNRCPNRHPPKQIAQPTLIEVNLQAQPTPIEVNLQPTPIEVDFQELIPPFRHPQSPNAMLNLDT